MVSRAWPDTVTMKIRLRKIVSLAVVCVILAVSGVLWHQHQSGSDKSHQRHMSVPQVEVAPVTHGSINESISALGVIQAAQQVQIAPQLSGQVVAITYQPGEYVKKGQILFRLDDRIYQAKLNAAQAALTLSKLSYTRNKALTQYGAQSKQNLDALQATYQQDLSAVSTNKTYLAQTVIRAPFSGYIGMNTVSVGSYVQPGQVLATLTDRVHLRVDYWLPEQYVTDIALNQLVNVRLSDTTHAPYQGHVTYIAPTVDSATHNIELQATITSSDAQLTPGLFVKVKQITHPNTQALMIPQRAVVPTMTGNAVYVVRDQHAYEVPVTVGRESSEARVAVLSGLQANEDVVVVGQQRLQNGSAIHEVAAP